MQSASPAFRLQQGLIRATCSALGLIYCAPCHNGKKARGVPQVCRIYLDADSIHSPVSGSSGHQHEKGLGVGTLHFQLGGLKDKISRLW